MLTTMSQPGPLPCSIHALCGACDRMQLSATAQLEAKVARVEKLLGQTVDRVHPSPKSLGYRARIELKTDAQGRLGYFRPRSHDHVVVPECVIARPELNAVIERLPALPGLPVVELRGDGERVVLHAKQRLSGAANHKAGQKRLSGAANHKAGQKRLSGAANHKAGQKRLSGAANRKALAALLKRHLGGEDQLADLGLAGVALDGRPLLGDCQLLIETGGIEHQISPGSFYQVNLEMNRTLVSRVATLVRERAASTILDLYSGTGNLSMPLARAGKSVVQLELAGAAIRDARATAEREGLGVDIREGDAGCIRAGDHFFDLAILDPPRAGAAGVLPELMTTRPRAILYVSCDPRSLARDLRQSESCGYRVAGLELFDMFPQTSHVETLCILERSS
jgi:23S rRNA (uracil1939-C5)-methyltransferase